MSKTVLHNAKALKEALKYIAYRTCVWEEAGNYVYKNLEMIIDSAFTTEEETAWMPKKDVFYWHFDDGGEISDAIWSNDSIDDNRLRLGNCFKTREEAIKARDAVQAVLRGNK